MKRTAALLLGTVQGIGFRPFVQRMAVAYGIAGFVQNEPSGVRIEAEGEDDAVDAFLAAIQASGPGGEAAIGRLDFVPVRGDRGFVVVSSALSGIARATLPPDLAPCAACRAEIAAEGPRYRYPFTSCTGCGPRWSIAFGVPWDRLRTTMAAFVPCAECAREYAALDDHRCHAQTIACPRCGPRTWLEDRSGARLAIADEAIRLAGRELRAGKIVALKGIGGWQLLADATNHLAVDELRTRKHREARPFAVLFANGDELGRFATLTDEERKELESPAAPIVLVRSREPSFEDLALSPSVAPTSRFVGAMLPASLLHALLAAEVGRPLVCTSGNLSDEPLAIDDREARVRLAPLADALLGHDREIVRPLDDSVVRLTSRGRILLRRARGFAPRAIRRFESGPVVLALGAHLKTTVALALADEIWLSAHVGNLGTPETLARLASTAREMLAIAKVRPEVIACDLHPDLGSTRLAEALARELGAIVVRVPHHAAHIAAVAAEHGIARPLFGLAWDGTGLGEDGLLWGGDAIALDGPRATRFAHLRPFALPGGESAIREPRRSALGLLRSGGLPDDAVAAWFTPRERAVLDRAIERGVNAPLTTSVGRLFDGVAALLGIRGRCRFEAEAAMELEQAALDEPEGEPYAMPIRGDAPKEVDWAPLIRGLLADRAAGAPTAHLAARFHTSLACAARDLVHAAGAKDVALSGGCFSNARLLSSAAARIEGLGAKVWTPMDVPPGDGGLCLGQALLASRRFTDVSGGAR